MPEITINLHVHTRHSDGTGTHQDIAEAALNAGLQAVIVTDHNQLVQDQEGYYARGKNSVLLLIGEEIHDQTTQRENNHLLVFGVNQELANLAGDTQKLINTINNSGGLSFLAHPIDPAAPRFNQGDFSWDKWDVTGYTGIELWNGFSEFKTRLTSIPEAIWYAYNPKRIARGPIPETMEIWDQLTAGGKKVVAVGGSDAHAMAGNLGPLKRTLFPYLFHFKCVNTHLILPTELTGDLAQDQGLIYEALAKGHAFIGYDLPYSSKGFHFKGTGSNTNPIMGDETSLGDGITLKITLPIKTDCILYKDGQPVKNWQKRESCTYAVTEPGVYKVEAYIQYKGRRRGWIYSNPIYIRK
ncbi:MAG: CehA/McbA family metallohydrolase [Anaerolineales bacterium]|nr:CehA/McbA family metallohydrolase [Anaerolineales bacterium]